MSAKGSGKPVTVKVVLHPAVRPALIDDGGQQRVQVVGLVSPPQERPRIERCGLQQGNRADARKVQEWTVGGEQGEAGGICRDPRREVVEPQVRAVGARVDAEVVGETAQEVEAVQRSRLQSTLPRS